MVISNGMLAAIIGVSVFMIVVTVPSAFSVGFLGRVRNRKLLEIDGYRKHLFVKDTTSVQIKRRLELALVFVFVISFLLSRSLFLSLVLSAGIWMMPYIIYLYLKGKRLSEFELQLPVGLDQLNGAIKSGMTLSQAFAEVAQYAPAPVSEEFGQIADDQKLGIDLPTALKSARARVDSRTFNLAVSAFLVNIEQGGDLPKAMATMSASLKEIWRLEQKLNTASAEGRKGAMIMCLMPVVITVIFAIGQPELLVLLVSDLTGYMALALAVTFYVLGVVWINKILNFNI